MLAAGTELGPYRILALLGAGGMGEVYRARDTRLARDVAVKVVRGDFAGDPQRRRRFEQEARAAGALNHPNVCTIFDVGTHDGAPFVVMELLEGESLHDRLLAGPLPLRRAIDYATQVASGLAAAHDKGIVHRDLKPGNVFVTRDGRVKVLDFGLAKLTRPDLFTSGGDPTLSMGATESGVVLGTAGYMAPEQVSGLDADARADLFSLGAILHEMVTGTPTFKGESFVERAHAILHAEPAPLSSPGGEVVPPELELIVRHCLEKEPERRFQSARDLAFNLGALASGQGVASHEAAVRTEAPNAMRTSGHAVRIAALAAGLLVAFGAVAAWQGWLPFPGGPHARGGGEATPKSWILVADFDGPPDDPSLARAARELVCAALDRSRVMGTVPREQVKLALRQAGKPDSLRLTPELAQEIAYRGTVRTVLEGEVARLGDRYTVTLRVADVEENRQVVTLSDVAGSKDALIPVLTRLGGRIREQLGEAPEAIQTTRGGEWAVATPSFEAYRRWADGLRIFNEGDYAGALKLQREAVAIDPAFGVAWASIGMDFWVLGMPDSARLAMEEAARHPQSLTPAYRLLNEGRILELRGDVRSAMDVFDRVTRLYPGSVEAVFAFNYEFVVLSAQGRLQEAFEADARAYGREAFGRTQMGESIRVDLLTRMGRLAEARSEAMALRGTFRSSADLSLALAGCEWERADSLATAFELAPGTGAALRVQAATARARVAAVRGEVSAAELHMERAERLQHEKGRPDMAPRTPRSRIYLAVVTGRPAPPLEPWLERDTTSSALITCAYAAVARGDTTRARHLLIRLRARSTIRMGAQGSSAEFIEAGIAARAGRWGDVVALIAQPAREGSDRGGSWPLDRIGTGPERWLVAQAYEKLGQPDSAAASYLRMLLPDARSMDSFARQRVVVLLARTGRIAEARRELAVLERDFTRPDPDMRHLLDEARTAVRAAGGGVHAASMGR